MANISTYDVKLLRAEIKSRNCLGSGREQTWHYVYPLLSSKQSRYEVRKHRPFECKVLTQAVRSVLYGLQRVCGRYAVAPTWYTGTSAQSTCRSGSLVLPPASGD